MRVPVYVSDTAIQYLENAQWVENPGPLFGRLVGEIIASVPVGWCSIPTSSPTIRASS